MSEDLNITQELIAGVRQMTRAERQSLLERVVGQIGVQAVADRLCESNQLVRIWTCKDPRTIPASKLQLLLKTMIA